MRFIRHKYPATLFLGVLTGAISISTSLAQVEGALVTRRGALIRGTVAGSLVALDEAADITIASGARVHGDLVLPATKADKTADAGNPGKSGAAKSAVSTRASVTVVDATSVKGRQRAVGTFKLPQGETPRTPPGIETKILASATGDEPDFKQLKDLTVRNKLREIALPPGVYGDLAVESGRVILGEKGSGLPTRYHFQRISVGADAGIDLSGPVVVIVGQLGAIDGTLGSRRYSNRLDLRVESGAVALGPNCELFGIVTASESAVTMTGQARVRGGIVCDQALLEAGAHFTGVHPSWSAEASGNALPRFIHNAARVEQQLPELVERYAASYAIELKYTDDEPVLRLSRTADATSPPDALLEAQALFDACCTLFVGTRFVRGVIIVERQAGSDANALHTTMERESFNAALLDLGGEPYLRNNIRPIRADADLLTVFQQRALNQSRG